MDNKVGYVATDQGNLLKPL